MVELLFATGYPFAFSAPAEHLLKVHQTAPNVLLSNDLWLGLRVR